MTARKGKEGGGKECTEVCGNPHCSISTGIHDGLTFGSGELDDFGYWSRPCDPCARAWERAHPEDGKCWPFARAIATHDSAEEDG